MNRVYFVVRVDCDSEGRIIAFSTESVYASSNLAWEHMRRMRRILLKEYGTDCVSIAKRYGGAYDIRLSYKTNIEGRVIESAWLVQEQIVHHSFITVRIGS